LFTLIKKLTGESQALYPLLDSFVALWHTAYQKDREGEPNGANTPPGRKGKFFDGV
jgi:hypothetical protein